MEESQLRDLLAPRLERPGDVLMQHLERDGLLVAPGCHSGMSAKIARLIYTRRRSEGLPCSFNTIYASGWAISAQLWGLPDKGFHDRSMMTLIVRAIVRNAYPLPVVADGEAFFGPDVSIPEFVRGYHDAGVAMTHFEDQEVNRSCGHTPGRKVVNASDFCKRLLIAGHTVRALGSSMRIIPSLTNLY